MEADHLGPVMLKVDEIHMYFGKVAALSGVSFECPSGGDPFHHRPQRRRERPSSSTASTGCIIPRKVPSPLRDKEITNCNPTIGPSWGISRTFQKIELFRGMTVLDNIRLGRHIHLKSGILSGAIYFGKTAREEIETREFMEEEIIDLLEIESIRHKTVGMLPYGLQKRVELGRALALNPKLLLLDEPLAGLNLEEVEDMARFILDINEEESWKITCILVEHDMGVVMDISDRISVLNFGNKITTGTPRKCRANPQVIEAYLGEEDLYATRR